MDADGSGRIGEQLCTFFTGQYFCAAIYPESRAIGEVYEKTAHPWVQQNVPDAHEGTITSEIRKSEGAGVKQSNQSLATAFE